jgi:hypothetical protein
VQTTPQPERSATPRQLTFKLNVAKAALLLNLLSREDDSARRVVEPTPLMELAAASVSGECCYRCVYCCYCFQRCTVCAAVMQSACSDNCKPFASASPLLRLLPSLLLQPMFMTWGQACWRVP